MIVRIHHNRRPVGFATADGRYVLDIDDAHRFDNPTSARQAGTQCTERMGRLWGGDWLFTFKRERGTEAA